MRLKMNEVALKEFLWMKGRPVIISDASSMSWARRQEIRAAVRDGRGVAEVVKHFMITRATLDIVAGDLLPPAAAVETISAKELKAEMVAKRDAKALSLYLEGMIYSEIAVRVGATEDIIVKLKRKHGWPDRKKPGRSPGPKSWGS